MINVFQPELRDEELAAVKAVMASNWTGRGKITDQFEAAWAAHLKVPRERVTSVTCCTEGLFQAVTASGVKPGDDVVITSVTFVGAANAVVAAGGRPVFADVDPRTLNPTLAHIECCLTPRTRAVLITHYGGIAIADTQAIAALCRERGITLIEDSACSPASRLADGTACGTAGDFGVWSFDSMKMLSTGDGGMIYCKPEHAAALNLDLYLGLGTTSAISKTGDRWWEFDVARPGRRAIMNDLSSAIGLEQLKKLDSFATRRRKVAQAYNDGLRTQAWLTPPPSELLHKNAVPYFYWVQTTPDRRNRLASFLRERQVYVTFRYYPLHRLPIYRHDGRALPGTELAANGTLLLPMHQALSEADVARVISLVDEFGRSL
ncbi:MAG TPA: aminotransferase class V-fold PLP-dependent enzyme [Vicinamibacterales bacterium]|nr:aminotransferase class V-fold PLP-dependent enzyme [Vicinamibacterales bacterium]